MIYKVIRFFDDMAFPFQKAAAGAWFEGRVRKSCVLISWYSTSDANILVPDVWIYLQLNKDRVDLFKRISDQQVFW